MFSTPGCNNCDYVFVVIIWKHTNPEDSGGVCGFSDY